MQHVDPYTVASDDECDVVLPIQADCRMGCRQCNTANAADNHVVVVECTDCLSTPGKDDCICVPVSSSRRAGLDNDDWIATQDWQEYEYRQGIYTLKVEANGPLVEQDIWVEEIATGRWSLIFRAETTVVDLAKFLKRKFDRNVWALIKSYFNSSYYNTGKAHYPFFRELFAFYNEDVRSWDRLRNQTAHMAYESPCRGYCLRCGEPAINGRSVSGIARTFASRGLVKVRTMKYGLGVMGICHRCTVTGFQYDIYRQRVLIETTLMQRGSLKF